MSDLDETDKAIIRAIEQQPLGAAGPSAIGNEIGKERAFVYHRLQSLQIDGIVEKPQDGLYTVVNNPLEGEQSEDAE